MGYLIYPWIDGYTLKRNEISEPHALKIAELTAKLHGLNLTVPDIGNIRFDIHSNANILNAVEKAIACECSFAKALKEKQNFLLRLNEMYLGVIPILKENTLITHGDIDQLNVIWCPSNEPTLIDWESTVNHHPICPLPSSP